MAPPWHQGALNVPSDDRLGFVEYSNRDIVTAWKASTKLRHSGSCTMKPEFPNINIRCLRHNESNHKWPDLFDVIMMEIEDIFELSTHWINMTEKK